MEGNVVKATGSNAAAAAGAPGLVEFTPIGYTAADLGGATSKTFTYTVVENKDTLPNVTYDEKVYTIKVTLTDNGSGQLTTSVQVSQKHDANNTPADSSFTSVTPVQGKVTIADGFVNKYVPTVTKWDLNGVKILKGGKALTAGAFTFEVYKDDETVPANKLGEAANAANGDIALLNDYEFATAGTYTFKVKEVLNGASASNEYTMDVANGKLTYDPAVWTVTVTVTDDNRGNLTVTNVVYNNGIADKPSIEFVNTFDPTDEELDPNPGADARLNASKVVNESTDLTNFAGDFKFEIFDQNNKKLAEGTNDAAGKITFYKWDAQVNDYAKDSSDAKIPYVFKFAAVGTYGYTMKEVVPAQQLPGVTYDTTEHHFHIVVTQDASTGALSAEVVGVTHPNATGQLEIVFNNSYRAAPVTVDISTGLSKVLKTSDGTIRPLQPGEFKFYLVDTGTNNSSNADDVLIGEGTNDANGKINFPKITYDTAGTYKYLLVEQDQAHPGITYDSTKYYVMVTVADSTQNGQLTAAVTYEKDGVQGALTEVVFENSYYGEPVGVTVAAHKNQLNKDLQGNDYTFVLTSEANQKSIEVKNGVDGSVVFDLAEFDKQYDLFGDGNADGKIGKVGTYTFILTEKDEGTARVTYDSAKYLVTVKVEDDGSGYLKAAVSYQKYDPTTQTYQPAEKTEFTNTYKIEGTVFTFSANKVLNGRLLLPGEFEFDVHDSHGTLVDTAKNGLLGGTVNFSIDLEQPGTYTFSVTERLGLAEHVTYDTTKHTFDVVVELNTATGKLEVVSNTLPSEGITFTNTYKVPEAPPPSDSPKTGDEAPLALWMVLAVASSLGTAASVMQLRKKRR